MMRCQRDFEITIATVISFADHSSVFEDDKQHVLIESINDPFLHVIHLLLLR